MATTKKPATKVAKPKAAAKKPAAKKPAAKKPAAKKAAVKKTAAKKPAAKAAVKKSAVKKPAVKKPAAKAAVKKPAAKKPAAKAAVKKPAAKPAVKKETIKPAAAKPIAKPVVEKPAAAKPLPAKPAAPMSPVKEENLDPDVKFRSLFEAYAQKKLPFAHGYIVSSFFKADSMYSIYEIVSYAGVKEIFMTETGLQFITGGKKLYVLVEPDTYQIKFQEPVSRSDGERIPKRFSELETIISKNQSRIMVAKEPNETYGSFTILKPQGHNFAVVFYQLPDVYASLAAFFEESLNKQRKVPQADAKVVAKLIASTVQKYMGFEGEFK